MSIKINPKTCIGCKKCTQVCPGNLLTMNNNDKSEIRDKKDCWDCAACVKICPVNAIEMYLQPEIGGRGSTLVASEEKKGICWTVKNREGSREKIFVESSKTFDM